LREPEPNLLWPSLLSFPLPLSLRLLLPLLLLPFLLLLLLLSLYFRQGYRSAAPYIAQEIN